nr:ogr/Delta-like zinc finger family protein [Cupriavidus basilensis]
MKINCPHCGAVAHIRTSRPVSRMTKEMYCQCTNVECGHTFVGLVEVVRTLSPSGTPDPDIAQQLAARSSQQAPAAS